MKCKIIEILQIIRGLRTNMPVLKTYGISKNFINEYSQWRADKELSAAKRNEYLRRNPDAIKDYDLQRAKILLSAVDMMTMKDLEDYRFFADYSRFKSS